MRRFTGFNLRVLFSCALLSPALAQAQGTWDLENFDYMGVYSRPLMDWYDSQFSGHKANAYDTESVDVTGVPPGWTKKGEGFAPPPIPVSKQSAIPYDSISGFWATAGDKNLQDMNARMIASPNSIYEISLALTEPAVADGHRWARSAAQQSLQSRYWAAQQISNQAAHFGEWGQQMWKEYHNCVTRRLAGAGEHISWVEAHSQCSGDIIPQNLPSNGIPGDGGIFDHEDDPYKNPAEGGFGLGGGGAGGPESGIRITHYIFGPPGSNLMGPDTEDLREDFLKYVGDQEVYYTKSSNGLYQNLDLTRYPPTQPPDVTFYEQSKYTYDNMLDLMWAVCGDRHPNGGSLSFQYKPFQYGPEYEEPGNIDLKRHELGFFSAPGAIMKPQTFDIIYSLFLNKAAVNKEVTETTCEEIFNSARWGYDIVLADLAGKKVSDEKRALFYLSQKIVMARMYFAFKQIEETVKRAAAGSFPVQAREQAFDLIYEVAGTRNIDEEYAKNIQDIMAYKGKMQEVAATLSGKEAAAMAGSFSGVNHTMTSK